MSAPLFGSVRCGRCKGQGCDACDWTGLVAPKVVRHEPVGSAGESEPTELTEPTGGGPPAPPVRPSSPPAGDDEHLGSLADARRMVREQREEGVQCPCCDQFAKVYKRKVHTAMAQALITMFRSHGREYQHTATTLDKHQSDEAKMRYWGLVEEDNKRRGDGGRAGWWRITALGEQFVLGKTAVAKYALIYDGECLGLTGDLTNIREALGDKFDYDELMSAPGREEDSDA